MHTSIKIKLLFIFFVFLLSELSGFSQTAVNLLNFTPSYTVPVFRQDQSPYSFPWIGGLNNPQFSEIDINFDGKKDLFIFERSEDRVLIFLNTAENQGEIAYRYSADYSASFPEMYEWALLRDYNNDGKEDIFTSSIAGIAVYQNTSSVEQVSFKKVTDLIRVHKKEYSTNLFVSSQDIPAIVDIDKDGDLDILTFYILGKYLTAYQNMSSELNYSPDSLHYVIADYCWGDFAEGNAATDLYLNEECPFTVSKKAPENKTLHTGSTVSTFDLDNDQDEDLLLGDIDSREIIALYNNTNGFDSKLYAYDTLFPNAYPISITSMPAVFFVDLNNDGRKDMIAAPNDNLISNHHQGVWAYLNKTDISPSRFDLIEKGFLQNDMIDLGSDANPLFYDLNKDGLIDIIAGSYGLYVSSIDTMQTIFSTYAAQLYYFENTGSPDKAQFTLKDDDLFGLSAHKLHTISPTFGDLNGDHIDELILGLDNGQLMLFEKQSNDPTSFDYQLTTANFANIDAGSNSKPYLIDLNNDQLTDLAIGNKDGFIEYYENYGSLSQANFSSTPTIERLGEVNLIDSSLSYYGYCHPTFYQTANERILISGSLNGSLHFYQIPNDLSLPFECLNKDFLTLSQLSISSSTPSISDLNADGFPEMIIGSKGGGLIYYEGNSPFPEGINEQIYAEIKIVPNPSQHYFTIHSNADIKKIQVFNLQGILVKCYPKAEQYATEGLSAGTFLLQISLQNGTTSFAKLVVL